MKKTPSRRSSHSLTLQPSSWLFPEAHAETPGLTAKWEPNNPPFPSRTSAGESCISGAAVQLPQTLLTHKKAWKREVCWLSFTPNELYHFILKQLLETHSRKKHKIPLPALPQPSMPYRPSNPGQSKHVRRRNTISPAPFGGASSFSP